MERDDDQLTSTAAVRRVEEAIWSSGDRPGELWSWGYSLEANQDEPHRWDAGHLFGVRLALKDEYDRMLPEFERLRVTVEGLDIVKRVLATHYESDPDLGLPDPLYGEKWRIDFSRPVIYDHRDADGK